MSIRAFLKELSGRVEGFHDGGFPDMWVFFWLGASTVVGRWPGLEYPGAQSSLIKEYTLNDVRDPVIVYGKFLN